MTEYKLVPFEPTEFSKGDTEPRGDCGMFVAGINHNPSSSPRDQWEHRIEVYGDTPEHAEELRDRALRALAAHAVQGEPVVWQPVDELRFEYRHPKTGEAYTVSLSREEVMEMMDQELFEKLTACFCECEPIGETNVVDCRCDEYADEFEPVSTPQPTEQQPTISDEIPARTTFGGPQRFTTAEQQPDVTQLVEALELFASNPIPTSEDFDKARAALAAHRKGGEV